MKYPQCKFCFIKKAGECEEKKCRKLSIEEMMKQKAVAMESEEDSPLLDFPDKYLRENLVMFKCKDNIFVTLSNLGKREESERVRKKLDLPEFVSTRNEGKKVMKKVKRFKGYLDDDMGYIAG